MKNRPLSTSVLAVLAAAVLIAIVPARPALAQNQTDAKIRLMSEALRARDAGDLTTAQNALTQLASISPNDPAVQRLRTEIAAQAAAQQAAAAAAAAPATAPAAQGTGDRGQATAAAPSPEASASAMVDVKIPEPGQPAALPVVVPTAQQEAEAIATAEVGRLSSLIANGQTQLATARSQVRDGRYDDAIATVDAALGILPVNPLTQKLMSDLTKEKASALIDRAQALLKRGDTEGARVALAAHDQLAPASSRTASLARELARSEAKPDLPASDSAFATERLATAQLIARGRAQYVAGDIDGAQGTFRAIEAKDPDNTVAKGFLLRIAEEKTETGALNREKTRAQLLEEVAKGH